MPQCNMSGRVLYWNAGVNKSPRSNAMCPNVAFPLVLVGSEGMRAPYPFKGLFRVPHSLIPYEEPARLTSQGSCANTPLDGRILRDSESRASGSGFGIEGFLV